MELVLWGRAAAEQGLRMTLKKRNTDAAARTLDGNSARGAEIMTKWGLRLESTPRKTDAVL